MGLVRAVTQAIAQPLAPSHSEIAISQSGLQTSSQAIRILQRTGKEDMAVVNQLTSSMGNLGKVTQGKSNEVGTKAGKVSSRYHKLKAIEKPFMAAMDDALKSAQLQAKMATKAAEVGQKIGVLNQETQAKLAWGHQEASANVAYYRSAYGDL